MKIKLLAFTLFFFNPAISFGGGQALTNVISDYRKLLESKPLQYSFVETVQLDRVVLNKYNLMSQSWSPQGVVHPEIWQHSVDIYIPELAKRKNVLVVINNGSNDNGVGNPLAPTNFSEEMLSRIAIATKMAVISVSNIPNQVLNYQGVNSPLAEDDSVAYSWRLFLNDGVKYQNASLHIPMSASVSQAFRLAKQELVQLDITNYIVTGASKRGWAAWLTALSDPAVNAVIPLAMDLLNTRNALKHMYLSYGKNWPIAFFPYYNQEIDKSIGSRAFSRLMTLEDPLYYMEGGKEDGFKISKYIINASGDDFYVPDNSHLYYGRIPGEKSLRVVPNSTHNGIMSVAEQSLITFLKRFQAQVPLPTIKEFLTDSTTERLLTVHFSEMPNSVVKWTAINQNARDFRFSCDIKYSPEAIDISRDTKVVSVPLVDLKNGWQATYIEATFDDGYVATTQVYITPEEEFPQIAPPSGGPACQTIPGRGLNPYD